MKKMTIKLQIGGRKKKFVAPKQVSGNVVQKSIALEEKKETYHMYDYEKKIAQLERKDSKISYKVKAFPTSKAGELAFGTVRSDKYQDIHCTITFFYKDPNESEEERLRIVGEKIPGILGRKGVLVSTMSGVA